MPRILVHLGGGIGNIIMATPAIRSLAERGHEVDLLLEADYADTLELYKDWNVPRRVASTPDELDGDYAYYLIGWIIKRSVPESMIGRAIVLHTHYGRVFHHVLSESAMYMHAAQAIDPALVPVWRTYCGHSSRQFSDITSDTVVLFPGCKKEYPMKKWDKYDELANRLDNVAVVGTPADLYMANSYAYPKWVRRVFRGRLLHDGRARRVANRFGRPYNHVPRFGPHVKNYIGKLSLPDTAALIRQAGCFVGNDGGLGHVAAALGTETYMIFGPSDVKKAHVPMDNIHIIRKGLECQPCQFHETYRRAWQRNEIGCPFGMKCMTELTCDDVLSAMHRPLAEVETRRSD